MGAMDRIVTLESKVACLEDTIAQLTARVSQMTHHTSMGTTQDFDMSAFEDLKKSMAGMTGVADQAKGMMDSLPEMLANALAEKLK